MPNTQMPRYQTGGSTVKDTAADTAASTAPTDIIGEKTGMESSLSNWAGPYVTDMLGRGQALAATPYEAYTGPLTAGASDLQQQAFQGVGNLVVPTEQMGAYTPETFDDAQASRYMNPFIQQSLQPQLQELQRQQEIKRIANAGRMAQAGAYGGGRQAVLESELDRAGLEQAGRLTGASYVDAYNRAQQQFNIEQDRQRQAQELANTYGLGALQKQVDLGTAQRGIESEGVAADMKQFEEEIAYPFKMNQYQASLLQNMPLQTQSYSYAQPSGLANILTGAAGTSALGGAIGGLGGGITDAIRSLFGGGGDDTTYVGGGDGSAFEDLYDSSAYIYDE